MNSDRAGIRALESVKGLLRTIDGLPKSLREESLNRLVESTALMNIELKLRNVHGLGSALSSNEAKEAIGDLKALDLKIAYRIIRRSKGAGFAVISDADLRSRLIPGRWQFGSLGRVAVKSHIEVGLAALDIRQIRECRTSLHGDKTIMEDAIRAHEAVALKALRMPEVYLYNDTGGKWTMAHVAVSHHEKAAKYAMKRPRIRKLKNEFGETVANHAGSHWND